MPRNPEKEARKTALKAVDLVKDKKALDVVLLEVGKVTYLADYFILCTGTSVNQVQTICESVKEGLESTYEIRPLRVEGYQEAKWVLMDYGMLIVHVFLSEEREFYNLERLWSGAGYVELENT